MKNKILYLFVFLFFYNLYAFSGEITNDFFVSSANITTDTAKQILKINHFNNSNKDYFKSIDKGDIEVVNAFLLLGYDINKQKFSGETPLMIAVKNNNYDLIKFLLDKGANVNEKMYSGQTAIGIAVSKKNEKLINLLKAYGAEPYGNFDINTLSVNLRCLLYKKYNINNYKTFYNIDYESICNIDKNDFNNPIIMQEDIKEMLYEIKQNVSMGNNDSNLPYVYFIKMANKYYNEKNYKIAFKYVNYALLFSKQSDAYFIRGKIYNLDKEYDRAIFDFKKVISLEDKKDCKSDNYYVAYSELSSNEIKNKNLDKALKYSQKAMQCFKYHSEIYKNYSEILLLLGKNKEANYYLSIYNDVLKIDNDILKDPTNSELYYKKALVYNELPKKNIYQVTDMLNKAIELSPKIEYYVMYGDITNDMEYYEKALLIDEFNGLALTHLGMYYNNQEKYEEALNYLLQAYELGYRNDNLLMKIARTYYYLGDNRKCFEYITLAEKDSNNTESTLELRIDIYLEQNDYKNAINYLNKIIKLNPKDSDAYMWRGFCKANIGNNNEALLDYTKSINYNKTSIAWFYRANLFYKLKNYNKALYDVNRYIENITSRDNEAYYLIANCYYCLKNYKEALYNYNEAAIYSTESLYRIAYCKVKLGDRLGAIYDLSKIEIRKDLQMDRENYLNAVKLLHSL